MSRKMAGTAITTSTMRIMMASITPPVKPDTAPQLDRGRRRFGSFVPECSTRARESLVQVLGREDAENHGQLHVELDALDTGSALAGHEVVVRRLAADHSPETDNGVEAAGPGHRHGCERQLERPRHPGNGSVCFGDAAAVELGQRSREEQTGHVPIETTADDGDPKPGSVTRAPGSFPLD